MANLGFQFKQFFIAHDQCAMKVNTDGILLGAIADINNATRILDIGTGTGLIAIMLAQRTDCGVQIAGLEIDPHAYQQAKYNMAHCPWSARLTAIQGGVFEQDFAKNFDLIVANPPYFYDSLPTRNAQRDLARTLNQSHLQWLAQAKKWLSPQGKIYFILPTTAAEKLLEQTESIGLYCYEQWLICSKANQIPKRQILGWQTTPATTNQHKLTIYSSEQQYTEQFKAFTQPFYLNM